jgi:hypothetical protein
MEPNWSETFYQASKERGGNCSYTNFATKVLHLNPSINFVLIFVSAEIVLADCPSYPVLGGDENF